MGIDIIIKGTLNQYFNSSTYCQKWKTQTIVIDLT